MMVLVILPSKSPDVIIACLNRAFFTFNHMCEHVGSEIFEHLATFRIRATAFIFELFAAKTVLAGMRWYGCSTRRRVWVRAVSVWRLAALLDWPGGPG